MNKCAILSMDSLDDFEAYDQLIEAPMAALGWHCDTISWRKQGVDWNDYQAVVIRTPWDYQNDAPAFIKVLEQIENSKAQLANSLATVKWNIDKQYLKELEQQGVTIVPTLWHSNLQAEQVAQFFIELGVEQLVIKPRISANADNTFWLTKANVEQFMPELLTAFADDNFMVQPFIESVISEGEFSLFYFNGEYSHAILKTPKADDFRVQEEHGGRLTSITPESNLLAHAEKTMEALNNSIGMPLYARVDFVRHNDGFALMEAELIEPSLYFNMDDKSAERFANAFVDHIKSV